MTVAVEQLHYTWSPRGVEGANRFQIAAISPGLRRGPLAALLPVVRKICRYDPPRTVPPGVPLPTSFGWFDHRGNRIAFCRTGLPPEKGKVGNFAAHVVVAPAALLSEHHVARSYGSSFWWRGHTPDDLGALAEGCRDFELRPVDLGEWAEREDDPVDARATARLAGALWTLPPTKRLAVTGDADLFGCALRDLARWAPEALRGLSVSTYEGRPTFPFTVTGADRPPPQHAVCALDGPEGSDDAASFTARRLLDRGPGGRLLREASRVLVGAPRADDSPRTAFWAAAERLVAAADDPGASRGDVAEVLKEPAGMAYVSGTSQGRERVAAAILADGPSHHETLRAARHILDPAGQEALANAIADRYAGTDDLRGCAGVVAALGAVPARGRLLDVLVSRAAEDEQAAATLSAADAAELVAHASAAEGDTPATGPGPLLLAACRHVSACARRTDVPDGQVAWMLEAAIDRGIAAEVLGPVLSVRPDLLATVDLTPSRRALCLESLPATDPTTLAPALAGLLAYVDEDAAARTAWESLGRLPERTAARCVAAAVRALRGPVPPGLADICLETAGALLRAPSAGSAGHAPAPALAVEVLLGSGTPDGQLAVRILDGDLWRPGEQPGELTRHAAGIDHPGLRRSVVGYRLGGVLGDAYRGDDVALVWAEIRPSVPDVTGRETLRELLALAAHHGSPGGNAVVLGWVAAAVLHTFPQLVSSRGVLLDRESQNLAAAMARDVPAWQFDATADRLRSAGRGARAWWAGLTAASRPAPPSRVRRW